MLATRSETIGRRASRVIASPRARRAMRQKGIDPSSVRGSGPNGRIVEADVVRAAASGGSAGTGSSFSLKATANVATLVSLQRQVAEQVEKLCGTPLKLGDLVLRAMALALATQPEANRVLAGGSASVSVGLESLGRARATIADANTLGLLDLVRQRANAAAGSGAKLALLDLSEAVVDECVPVVQAPSSAVLGLGRCLPRPIVIDDELAVRPTINLVLAADARVVSPQTAAELLGKIVELLERPFVLICDRPPW